MVSIQLEESPTITHRTITLRDVSDRPIDLIESIKSPISLVAHLAYAVMRSILSIHSPVAFLGYQRIKAFELIH